jgi:hypothetical protein
VRHAGREIEAISREINHFAYIADVSKPRVEGLYLKGKRHFQTGTLPRGLGRLRHGGVRGRNTRLKGRLRLYRGLGEASHGSFSVRRFNPEHRL